MSRLRATQTYRRLSPFELSGCLETGAGDQCKPKMYLNIKSVPSIELRGTPKAQAVLFGLKYRPVENYTFGYNLATKLQASVILLQGPSLDKYNASSIYIFDKQKTLEPLHTKRHDLHCIVEELNKWHCSLLSVLYTVAYIDLHLMI